MRRLDLALVAILVLAAALRLHGICAESLDMDEASTLLYVSGGLRRVLLADRINPPLYYLFAKAWTAVAGNGELALRLPSAIFGTATVGALYALGRALADRGVARGAALLLALSVPHIGYSQSGRMYALAILLAVGATLALLRAISDGGTRRWAIYALLAVALGYTHFSGLVVLFGHAVAVAIGARERWRPAVATGVVLAVALAPLVPVYFLAGLLSPRGYSYWQPRVSLGALGELAASWIAGARTTATWAAPGLLLPALVAAGARRPRGAFALAILYGGLAAFVALALAKPVWHPRYVAVLLPLFVAGLALSRRAVVTGLLVAAAAAGMVAAKLGGPIGEDWRGVVAFMAVHGDGPVIIAGPQYLCRPFVSYGRRDCTATTDAGAVIARASARQTDRSVYVVYPDQHFPVDPGRTTVAPLAQRLGWRAAADLRELHVEAFGR